MKAKYFPSISLERFLLFLILIFSVLSFFILFIKQESTFKDKIAVTIFPFYDITKEIVGDKFEVILIITPGADPHNFEITPKDILKISGSKIIFWSGTHLDFWAKNIVSNLTKTKIVEINKNLPLIIEEEEEGGEGEGEGEEIDPHFWFSLENMKKIAENITEEIVKIDPKNRDYYLNNLESLKNKIDNLKEKSIEELKDIKFRYFVTQHNAFQYLAKELNFQTFYLESAHKELTPQNIKDFIDKIRIFNIKSIFSEPGEVSSALENIAQNLNLKIYELDPLEGKGSQNFFEGYERNIKVLKEALGDTN